VNQLNQSVSATKDPGPAVEVLIPYLRQALVPTLGALFGEGFALSVARPQGNLNYTYLVMPSGSSIPSAVLKVKNRTEFEHPITRKLSAPYEKEKVVLDYCTSAKLPVSSVIGAVIHLSKTVKGAGPFVCLLQRFIAGTNGRVIAAHRTEAELSLLARAGAVAREIHQIRFSRFGDVVSRSGDFTKSWGAYLDNLFKFPLRTIAGFLNGQDFDTFSERFKELRNLKGQGVLVHADLHLGNMLFDAVTKELTGVIDWERSRSSRSSEEFARILYENFVLGQRFTVTEIAETISSSGVTPQFANFLSGYGIGPEEYQSSLRRETETFLALFCAGFWTRWELEYKVIRPDWAAPAQYAQQVVRSVLGRG